MAPMSLINVVRAYRPQNEGNGIIESAADRKERYKYLGIPIKEKKNESWKDVSGMYCAKPPGYIRITPF